MSELWILGEDVRYEFDKSAGGGLSENEYLVEASVDYESQIYSVEKIVRGSLHNLKFAYFSSM